MPVAIQIGSLQKKEEKEKNLRDTPSDYGMAQKVVIA
jgi:hypothetical protein